MGKQDFSGILKEYQTSLKSSEKGNLDFCAKFLNDKVPHYDWVGIYMIKGEELVLETFSGKRETVHTRIKVGDGICGLAAEEQFTVIVPDVSKEPKYISCFPETKSEIVVPIFKGEKVIGEIDIDSDSLNPFSEEDKNFLEEIANLIGRRT